MSDSYAAATPLTSSRVLLPQYEAGVTLRPLLEGRWCPNHLRRVPPAVRLTRSGLVEGQRQPERERADSPILEVPLPPSPSVRWTLPSNGPAWCFRQLAPRWCPSLIVLAESGASRAPSISPLVRSSTNSSGCWTERRRHCCVEPSRGDFGSAAGRGGSLVTPFSLFRWHCCVDRSTGAADRRPAEYPVRSRR